MLYEQTFLCIYFFKNQNIDRNNKSFVYVLLEIFNSF